jgi:tRNA (mo5U34)-methyltransferase
MLILSRKLGESIVIDDRIRVKIMRLEGEMVKIGIDAPASVPVHRQEVYDEIQRNNQQAILKQAMTLPKLAEGGGKMPSLLKNTEISETPDRSGSASVAPKSNSKAMKELSMEDVEAINAIRWWHRIPVGLTQGRPFYTPGEVQHGPDGSDYATKRFGLPLDLTGKTVLDIGAWDGYFSYEAEKRSAAMVVASDIALTEPNQVRLEKGNWGANKGFRLAHKLLASKVRFIESSVFRIDEALHEANLNIKKGSNESECPLTYDVTCFYGVLYHLIEPFLALQKVAAVTKGVALVETAISKGNGLTMELRPGFDNDPTNWWYPTIPCLREMLIRAGFSRTEVVFNLDDVRATVAAYK